MVCCYTVLQISCDDKSVCLPGASGRQKSGTFADVRSVISQDSFAKNIQKVVEIPDDLLLEKASEVTEIAANNDADSRNAADEPFDNELSTEIS